MAVHDTNSGSGPTRTPSLSSVGLKFFNAQTFADGSTCYVDQMVVMGEVNDLGFCCQFAKRLEALGGAIIAVFDEKIIGDEWEGLGVLQLHLNGGETEGQEELIFGAFAQSVEIYMLSIRTAAHKLRRVAVVIDLQVLERPQGQS